MEYPFSIAESMLCAGEQGKDSCQGETLSLSIRLNDQTIELSSSRHKENFGIESNNKF